MITLLIILGLVVLVGGWLWATYNSLVASNVRVDEAWSDITVQMKRRYDLIPNLVNTVKGYAKHEKEVLENVTKARSAVLEASKSADVGKAAQAENMFTDALKSIFALAEAYPDLKADENFRQLQSELVDTEDKIQAARRFYNGSARDLNIKIKVFPTNLFARSLGFKEREFFEVEAGEAEAVKKPVNVEL